MVALNELSARQAQAANRIEVDMMETRLYLVRYSEAVANNDRQMAANELDKMRKSFANAEARYAEFGAFEVDESQRR